MEILLRVECDACLKKFIVSDADVDDESLTCPHCQDKVPVPDAEEDE